MKTVGGHYEGSEGSEVLEVSEVSKVSEVSEVSEVASCFKTRLCWLLLEGSDLL